MLKKKKRKSKAPAAKIAKPILPHLTIAVIVDDSARFLMTTLKSVFAQSLSVPYEVIIVDNSSIDRSAEMLRNYLSENDYKASVHRLAKKVSLEDVHRYIFEHSKGDYLIHLQSNDFFADKNACKKMVALLDSYPGFSAVCGRTKFADKNGNEFNVPVLFEEFYAGTDYSLKALIGWQSPSFLNNMVYRRKAILKEAEHFNKLSKDIPFDKRVLFHLLNSGHIKVLNTVTYKHRYLGAEDMTVYSNGSKPYLKTYKAVCLLEKQSKEIYQKRWVFEKAKTKIWADLCEDYCDNPNKDLAKEFRRVLRLSETKAQYKYLYKKTLFRSKKRNKIDNSSNGALSAAKVFEYPLSSADKKSFEKAQEKRPMVSVGMTVYNQEEYLPRAIESILAQKVNFDYELVIAEDCSTDRSREIVKEYAERYPDIIKLVLQEHNVGLKEQSRQLRRICKGKYRTHLEGDDYWLTTDRLQKQVDFLESHPDFIAVTGRMKTVDQNNVECPFPYGDINSIYSFAQEYTLQHFEKWLLPSHTGALLYRNVYYLLDEKTRQIYEEADIAGDRKTALFLTMQGRVHCMNEYITVRRIVNTPTNFTTVNRSAHPYSMIYDWMNKLEKFAMDTCGVKIDLSDAKEMQWLYATHYFFKNPSKLSFYHVRRIYALSDEKVLYRRLLALKIKEKWQRAIRDLGFFKTIAKANRLFIKMIKNFVTNHEKSKLKDTSSVLFGHSTK